MDNYTLKTNVDMSQLSYIKIGGKIKEGEKKNIQISTPFIGERVILNDNAEYPSKKWWSELVHNNSEKDIYISEEIVDSQESYKDDYIKDIKKAN